LKANAEPTELLLQTMRQVPATLTKAVPGHLGPPAMTDIGQERPAPSTRVIAVQRALSEYGYGQIRPTGVIDADTQRAIEKFERDRNLPITRQYSERLARELAALSGRVLD
jgi:peptidoglycan hydrolase-like protein with peptidoglycan-binding domain